jgi:hypothetical protein
VVSLTTFALWAIAIVAWRATRDVLTHHDIMPSEGYLEGVLPAWLNPTAPQGEVEGRSAMLYAMWSPLYWWCAARLYLRIRWALLHVLVLQFVAFLVAAIVLAYGEEAGFG